MNIRKDIKKFSPCEYKEILLWLLDRYSYRSKWDFVAKCTHERYGVLSYQTNRVWTPTEEGKALYYYFTKEMK